jgi:cytoskeletal protein CcmA (bactofilin family)
VVGGSIEVSIGAELGGSLVAGGGNVTVNAPISEGANIAAGNLIVNNLVNGDLTARFGTARFTSNARVNGDFHYWTEEDISVDEKAYISGTVTRHQIAVKTPSKKDMDDASKGIGMAFGLSSLVTTLVLGLLILKFMPKFALRASKKVREKFWASLLWGILAMIVAPILAILMLVTVLGIPLGVMFIIMFVIFVYVSRIFAIMAIGAMIMTRVFKKKDMPSWGFVLGLLVYFLLGFVPIVGGVAKLVVVLTGIGAELMAKKEAYKEARKANLL